MRPFWLPVLWGALLYPTPLPAQWYLGLEVGTERFSGVAREIESQPARSFLPYRPTVWALRLESPDARVRLGVGLRYSGPDLALSADDLTIVSHESVVDVVGLLPQAIIRLARLTPGVSLRAEAGPLVERWKIEDGETRYRVGGVLGTSLEVALGGRFRGTVGGWVGVTPRSPLDGSLPEELELRAAWRRGLRGAVLIGL